MPVETRRADTGVYITRLSGSIVLDHILDAQREGAQMAADNGDTRYVLIIDIDSSTRMPFDLRQSGKVLESNQAAAVLTVGASLHIKFIASMLARFFRLGHVEHVRNLDEAIQKARKIVAE
jgi:hypothetical protein